MEFNLVRFVEMLPNMGYGMLGIFVVIGAIVIWIVLKRKK